MSKLIAENDKYLLTNEKIIYKDTGEEYEKIDNSFKQILKEVKNRNIETIIINGNPFIVLDKN